MTIAFIGAGNMAGSLIRGLRAGGYLPGEIVAADPAQSQLDVLSALGIATTTDNAERSPKQTSFTRSQTRSGDVLQALPH